MTLNNSTDPWEEYDIPTFLRKPRKVFEGRLGSVIDELDSAVKWPNAELASEIQDILDILN